jgi:hypothetical protein
MGPLFLPGPRPERRPEKPVFRRRGSSFPMGKSLESVIGTKKKLRSSQRAITKMPRQRKRSIDDVDAPEPSSVRQDRNVKRKTDAAAAESQSDTSYVSAAAAIFSDSDSGVSTETAQTDVEDSNSDDSSTEEEDSSSDDSSSEEEDSDQDEEEQEQQEITNVRPGVKPEIRRVPDVGTGLLDRLRSFLPQMEKANEELEKERDAGTLGERSLEVVGEQDGPYIEMVCLT